MLYMKKGKKDSKLHFHCITPTQFSNSFFGFLDRKPKKVEKEKNVYLEMMIYIPALLQNSSITWGVSEMGTHMCSYNSPWCYRPFCLLRNSSNFRWWGWYVMHSSLEFLFRNFFWDILELKKILGFLTIFVHFVEKVLNLFWREKSKALNFLHFWQSSFLSQKFKIRLLGEFISSKWVKIAQNYFFSKSAWKSKNWCTQNSEKCFWDHFSYPAVVWNSKVIEPPG